MKRSDTQTIIDALRVLELISDDGIAQALILEAADRMDELQRQRVAADRLAEAGQKARELIAQLAIGSDIPDEIIYPVECKLVDALSAYTATKGGE